MFLGEALLMGIVGSIAGIAGGFYLAAAADKLMGSIAASVYGVDLHRGRTETAS